MHVFNVHRRQIRANVAGVGRLIDTLASADDRLWPRPDWPAMRFDRPGLQVGATGGHGQIGYCVRDYDPGRSVTFEFTNRPPGLRGTHCLVAIPDGDGCVLWHLSDADLSGVLRLLWYPVLGPLHDALVEDSLTRAQLTVGDPGAGYGPHWSVWVRILRAISGPSARRAERTGRAIAAALPMTSSHEGGPASTLSARHLRWGAAL